MEIRRMSVIVGAFLVIVCIAIALHRFLLSLREFELLSNSF
jgi:hypothetical protein